MLRSFSRKPWFARSWDHLNNKAKLQLLRLEDRVVPTGSLDVTMLDAIGYTNKTIALTLSHTGSGTSAGSIDWGDGTSTTTLAGWSYSTATKVFTHSYAAAGTFKITATDTNLSNSDNESLVIMADVAPPYAVDVIPGMEFGAYATSSGNNPKNTSSGMVRYADGVIDLHFPDLESTGFGMPFGITRSWSNGPGYDTGTDLGQGWNINQLPTITQVDGTNVLSAVIDGNQARTFDVTTTATVYRERFFGQHQLTHDTGNKLYVLTTPGGMIYKFRDFDGSWDAVSRGTFNSRTDANGNVTSVYSRSSGYITEIRRDDGDDDYESWLLTYSNNQIASITLRRGDDTNSYTNYRKVEYTYYQNDEDHGNPSDLKLAVIKDGSNNIISTQYMRYFLPGEADGFAGALRMYVGFASYERADTALDPLTAADGDLDDFADLVLEYDSSRRVTLQKVQGMGCSMCSAGIGEYTFSYTSSSHGAPPGINHWAMKTTETLPDGNQNIVYTNAYGQVMQSVQKDGGSYWRTHYVYDGLGKVTQKSNPSATTNVNESDPTLVVTNGARLGIEAEFRVNTYTTGHQYYNDIARDHAGNYVVVWASSQDGSGYGVYAQRYNSVGQPQGAEFRVNTTTTGAQSYPQVTMDADGDFVVVWVSPDGDSTGIAAQRYNKNGVAQGSEFVVNSVYTWSHQHRPAIASDDSGDFVISWQSYQESGAGYGIYAQRYNSAGTTQGGVIHVNTYTTGYQYNPSIDLDADGDFVIVWFDNSGHDGSDYGCYGQRFNASGTPQGSEFLINTTTSLRQSNPNVAMAADGDFVVAWMSYSVATENDVYMQRYNAAGTPQGTEYRVNTYTAYAQGLQDVACNAAGDFMITWSSIVQDGSQYGVYGSFFMADGTIDTIFKINDFTTNDQVHQHVASDYDGNFVVSWTSDNQAGDSDFGIFARQLERTYTYVANSTGLVERYHYARVNSAVSSSSTISENAGDIAGFLKSTWIVQGENDGGGNVLIKQSALTYFLHSDGTNTVSPLATSTVYRNDDGTGGQTTTMGYTFASSSLKLTEVTVAHPTVTTAQNGPNSAVMEYTRLDSYGRPTWTKDGDGFLTYRRYDDASGASTYSINDVDTAQTKTFTGAAPWSTPGGGGLHLTNSSLVDFLGRPTSSTDPKGSITYTVYNDPDHQVSVYSDWDTSLYAKAGGPTGPISMYREDWAGSYTESLTFSDEPSRTADLPDGDDTIVTLQSMSRTRLNDAGQAIARDDYFNFSDMSYPGDGTININYYRTLTDYAPRGGVRRTETPTGTVTRYTRDALNRVTHVWIGTDDEPASGYWPDETDATDLTLVQYYTFDGGGVGDGNMTMMMADPGAATDRRTDYFYDWRNRLIAVKSGVQSSESATLTTQRPLSYNVYNNLNQVTESRTYDGDKITLTVSGGVVSTPTSSALRSLRTTEYDERGRVFATHVYSVDQSSGAASDSSMTLDTGIWYDARGNTIKQTQPGGLVTKFTYDGVGRLLTTFHSDGGSDSGYGDADDVTNDTVYEETWNQYDSNSNLLKVTTKQRFHDASGTGPLGDRTTNPKARTSYAGMYYDTADRLVAQVNEGTNAGSTWTWNSTVPTRSATELLYTFTYDSAGRRYQTVDPRNIESRTYYDALGRTTKTIEAYVNGTVSDQDDKTTEFEYDGMNHLISYKAWLNSTDYQETGYEYGVTTGGGSEINSKDLLQMEKFPDKSTGAPSSSSADQISYKYNQLGQRIEMTDRNGNVHAYSFDVVGRPTADAVTTLGSGVDGTVRRLETAYDTAGRAYLFTSRAGSADTTTVVNQVQREFNGLGQMTAEHQEHTGSVTINTSPKIQYAFSEMTGGANHSRLVTITYPVVSKVDDRSLDYNYDGISRITSIVDGKNTLESLDYLGLGTVAGRSHSQPNVNLLYYTSGSTSSDSSDQYTGFDRFGRVVDQKWSNSTTVPLDRFKYGYDENGNRLYKDVDLGSDTTAWAGFDELYHADGNYGYDLLNQLQEFQRGTLTGTDTITSESRRQVWDPDALGNFDSVATTEKSTTTETRTHNRQNQLLTVSTSTITLTYDNAGNMTKDASNTTFSYDAWNRMMAVGGTGRYGYDPLNRRLKEGSKTFYYSNNWQVLEERNSGAVDSRYAWSPVYVDGMIARDRDTNADNTLDERLYVMHDGNFNVTGIVNTSGTVQERYAYDPYGSAKILTAAWADTTSAKAWIYLHQGGRMDATSGMYHFRFRDADSELMRWNRTDPITQVGDVASDKQDRCVVLGHAKQSYTESNLFLYLGTNPLSRVDPIGLQQSPIQSCTTGIKVVDSASYLIGCDDARKRCLASTEMGRRGGYWSLTNEEPVCQWTFCYSSLRPVKVCKTVLCHMDKCGNVYAQCSQCRLCFPRQTGFFRPHYYCVFDVWVAAVPGS